ncbi:Calcium/calmodulin-dependent protein kinase I [Vanrija pseudolonga]|uniref:Calcium/calmodulin-dependent protein kinase I n=1 Tax=Vanrija pseudolonga TaxID=143232 RepID=A0AAF1BMM8_9TREE|nr:Calcium/calmodulin-dependent protein kinase I [Vanrija pseudolonga]
MHLVLPDDFSTAARLRRLSDLLVQQQVEDLEAMNIVQSVALAEHLGDPTLLSNRVVSLVGDVVLPSEEPKRVFNEAELTPDRPGSFFIREDAPALGQGGQAAVWPGLAVVDSQVIPAAIKVIPRISPRGFDEELCGMPICPSERYDTAWGTEIGISEAVHNPNVIKPISYDGVSDENCRFISFPLAQGGSLFEHCGRIALDDVFDIGWRIADGLRALHTAGIIHRDIKPGNIFLFGHADTGFRATVGDLGLAVRADADVDIYALGATVYEAVVGHALFQPENPYAESPFDHQSFQGAVGQLLERTIRSMLSTRPEYRPTAAHVKELFEALEDAFIESEEATSAGTIPIVSSVSSPHSSSSFEDDPVHPLHLFESLPAELLVQIHHEAGNVRFPETSLFIRDTLRAASSTLSKARFFMFRYRQNPPLAMRPLSPGMDYETHRRESIKEHFRRNPTLKMNLRHVLSRALDHPVVTLKVAKAIISECQRLGIRVWAEFHYQIGRHPVPNRFAGPILRPDRELLLYLLDGHATISACYRLLPSAVERNDIPLAALLIKLGSPANDEVVVDAISRNYSTMPMRKNREFELGFSDEVLAASKEHQCEYEYLSRIHAMESSMYRFDLREFYDDEGKLLNESDDENSEATN